MNLTSKRMLKSLAACVGACALTASAAETWVSDSFETGSDGQAINTYRAEAYGQSDQYTNYFWKSMEGDESKIVTTEGQVYGQLRPITNITANFHLNLETEGTTLVRYLKMAVTNESYGEKLPVAVAFNADTNLYIDTLIKFTPSEDDPEIDPEDGVKVAVFVNANSNLVVYHKTYTNAEFSASTLTNSVTSKAINPDAWYRLTIKMGKPAGLGENACMVFVDQTPLTHYNAYDDEPANNGSWFVTASSGDDITQVSFQGTGALDDFVVADSALGFADMGILLTLSFDDSLVQVWNITDAGAAVASNGTVAVDSELAIEAKTDWYEIFSVVGADTGSYSGTPAPGAAVIATTGTVSATANDTLTVTAQQFSGGTVSTGLGGGSLPADKVAAWATTGQTLAVGDLTEAMLDDYLLDVPAGTEATISITSVAVDGTTVTIKVAADKPAVDLGAINGTLKVVSSDILPISGEATYIPFNTTAGVATIEIENSGKFIKATVE